MLLLEVKVHFVQCARVNSDKGAGKCSIEARAYIFVLFFDLFGRFVHEFFGVVFGRHGCESSREQGVLTRKAAPWRPRGGRWRAKNFAPSEQKFVDRQAERCLKRPFSRAPSHRRRRLSPAERCPGREDTQNSSNEPRPCFCSSNRGARSSSPLQKTWMVCGRLSICKRCRIQ